MTAPVFLAEAGGLSGARPGGTVTLTGEEARHAVAVRRLRAGERVELVDGAGLRVAGTVRAAERSALTVDVAAVEREDQPEPRLILVQALAKGGRDEQAVEAATELGVDAVVPWQADRCVAVWTGPGKGDKAAKGRRRWEAVVRAAAKQSRRARVPEVRAPVTSRELLASLRAGATTLVLHETAETPLDAVVLPRAGEVLVVVGPEGGITEEELSAFTAAGGQVCRLGPHVLRSSTAGPAALAVLASRSGRWA